jgi:hypothetical protein
MTAKKCRALTEVTRRNGAKGAEALIDHLADAIAELNLSPLFLERVQTAVTGAIHRAWQYDNERNVSVTVAAHVLCAEDEQNGQNWGFFLVEKRLVDTVDRRIEVLLYLDRRESLTNHNAKGL